jgi:thiol-disulfide isomerase/thioredoxin
MHRVLVALSFVLVAVVASAPAQTESARAYEKLLGEVKSLEHGLHPGMSQAQMEKVFGQVERKFLDFIQRYSQSPEAIDARYQLGVMYARAGMGEKAIPMLEELLSAGDRVPPDKAGVAHYFMGQVLIQQERFDEAEKHLKTVLEDFSSVDPRLTQAASDALGSLGIMKRLAVGKEPIPFEVLDLNGKPLSLKDYKGKVVLLDFWATWCTPCRREMPNVIKLYKTYNKKGFEIVGISLDMDKRRLLQYLQDTEITWRQYFDGKGWQNDVAKLYGIKSIPTTFLIDRKGKIRYKSLRGEALADAVKKLWAE